MYIYVAEKLSFEDCDISVRKMYEWDVINRNMNHILFMHIPPLNIPLKIYILMMY